MAKSKVVHRLIPEQQMEMTEQRTSFDTAEEYAELAFDQDFWLKVKDKVDEGLSWHKAMDERRAERLMEDSRIDPLFRMIYWWPKLKKYKQKSKFNHSLEYLISRLTEIILEKDKRNKYEAFFVEDIDTKPSLLHLAAEQNFLHVSRCLVERYPSLLYQGATDDHDSLPVELALRKRNDDTAAYLISQMQYDRVEDLFLSVDNKEKAKFYFGNIISGDNARPNENNMKKTVLAVLDKLINPHWPYVPDRPDGAADKEDIDRALESVPDDPMNYDFKYHILEADEMGRRPKIPVATGVDEDNKQKITWTVNGRFNHKSMSCLQRIADSENKEAVQHPVVRMLIMKKWKKFAFTRFRIRGALYLMFLILLSVALVYGTTRADPTQYSGQADKFRGFCEILSIIFLMVHLFDEIGEIAREGKIYFKIWHNYFDCLGIILTLLVLPLRLANSKSQWGLAALGYIFNFVRLYKFSSVSRTMGLYTTTLVNIIQRDITRFMLFFSALFLGFCGAIVMALKMNDMQDHFGDFQWLMLAGFRALIEQQPLEEEYKKFGWLTIVILLSYMAVVIVILLNILIAQLSYTYSEAKQVAKLQYAADVIRIVTRVEYSRFKCWSLREKYYEEGNWLNDEDLAQEFLEYTEERHPWETVEDRVISVREIMRKFVGRGKERDPMESMDEKLTRLTDEIRELKSEMKSIK